MKELRAHGFTLMEMLVTLALMSMISTLLWQSMRQVYRVEGILERSGMEGQLALVRREWIRGWIHATAPEVVGRSPQTKGDARTLWLAVGGGEDAKVFVQPAIRLEFEPLPSGKGQRLMLMAVPVGTAWDAPMEPKRIELLRWRGQREGVFRYLGNDGIWHDQWPQHAQRSGLSEQSDASLLQDAQAALPRLPRAIWLDIGPDAGGPLIAQVAINEPGRPSLAQLERR